MKKINNKGEGVLEVIIFTGFLIFIILPVFAVIINKGVTYYKIRELTDIVDLANIACISNIEMDKLSEGEVIIDPETIMPFLKEKICESLDADYSQSDVTILELEFIKGPFPQSCSCGTIINKPCIHSMVKFEDNPILFTSLMGIDDYSIIIHVDTEIPIDK